MVLGVWEWWEDVHWEQFCHARYDLLSRCVGEMDGVLVLMMRMKQR